MPSLSSSAQPTGFRFAALRTLLVSLALSAPATAQTASAPSEFIPPAPRGSRLLYDAQTDQWKIEQAPEPGTENGDLDIARQYIARQDWETAYQLIKAWIKQYGTGAERYPEALYLRAIVQLERGEYRAANDDLKKFLNDYPGSEYAERALSAQFRIAEQYLAGRKRRAFWGLLRIKDRDAGVKIMDDISANYADTPLAELAMKSKADYFYARGDFEQAQEEYASFARDYPRSRYHAYALLRSAESALASFNGVHFDDAGLIEAQERYRQFMQEYPQVGRQLGVPNLQDELASKRADKTFEIGRHYEKYATPAAARYYYRATVKRWPGTAAAEQAQARLAALGEGDLGDAAAATTQEGSN